MDADGSHLYVGAERSNDSGDSNIGAVHVYVPGQVPGQGWSDTGTVIRPLTSGGSVNYDNTYFGTSISVQGNLMAIGAYGFDGNDGAVYIFSGLVDPPLQLPYAIPNAAIPGALNCAIGLLL